MFERILVPLDGSEIAESILPQVTRLLRRQDCHLHLLRVVDVHPGADFDAPVDLAGRWAEAEKYLNYMAKSLGDRGIRLRTSVVQGNPADVIRETTIREKIGMVAMSTHGRSGIRRWLFGSVTEKVLRSKLEVPILVVRSFPTAASASGEIRRILVPVDGSGAALAVIPSAVELARLFGAMIVAVHVTKQEFSFPLEATPEHRLGRAVEALREAGADAVGVLAEGDPGCEILEACRVHCADLIAMTTHGRSGLSRWVLGSVTEKVLRASEVPMLVVPGFQVEPSEEKLVEARKSEEGL